MESTDLSESGLRLSLTSTLYAATLVGIYFGSVILANTAFNDAGIAGFSNGHRYSVVGSAMTYQTREFSSQDCARGCLAFVSLAAIFGAYPRTSGSASASTGIRDFVTVLVAVWSIHLVVLLSIYLRNDLILRVGTISVHQEPFRYVVADLVGLALCSILLVLRSKTDAAKLAVTGMIFFCLRLTFQANWPPVSFSLWRRLAEYFGTSYSEFGIFFILLSCLVLSAYLLVDLVHRRTFRLTTVLTLCLPISWCLVDLLFWE